LPDRSGLRGCPSAAYRSQRARKDSQSLAGGKDAHVAQMQRKVERKSGSRGLKEGGHRGTTLRRGTKSSPPKITRQRQGESKARSLNQTSLGTLLILVTSLKPLPCSVSDLESRIAPCLASPSVH